MAHTQYACRRRNTGTLRMAQPLKAGKRIARELVIGIIEQTIKLGKNPQIGQIEELLKNRPEEFRYLVYKNYKIIYWVNTIKNRVDVVNVFDTRQNPKKIEKLR